MAGAAAAQGATDGHSGRKAELRQLAESACSAARHSHRSLGIWPECGCMNAVFFECFFEENRKHMLSRCPKLFGKSSCLFFLHSGGSCLKT